MKQKAVFKFRSIAIIAGSVAAGLIVAAALAYFALPPLLNAFSPRTPQGQSPQTAVTDPAELPLGADTPTAGTPSPDERVEEGNESAPGSAEPGSGSPGGTNTSTGTETAKNVKIPTTEAPKEMAAFIALPSGFGVSITPFVCASSIAASLPSDFSLGPLADLRPGATESAAVQAAIAALDALKVKTVPVDLYDPDRLRILQARLSSWRSNGPEIVSYRLGVPFVKASMATLNLRVYSEIGRAEGEIELTLRSGVWLVSDLRIDLADLSTRWSGRATLFIPDYYEQFEP
jgi:hypothetical protein